MKVLVVWQMIPNESRFFLITARNKKGFNKVLKANGNMINGDTNDLNSVVWLHNQIEHHTRIPEEGFSIEDYMYKGSDPARSSDIVHISEITMLPLELDNVTLITCGCYI